MARLATTPSEAERTARTSLGVLGTANRIVNATGTSVPYGNAALGGLGLLTNPTPQTGLGFAGSVLSTPQVASSVGDVLGDNIGSLLGTYAPFIAPTIQAGSALFGGGTTKQKLSSLIPLGLTTAGSIAGGPVGGFIGSALGAVVNNLFNGDDYTRYKQALARHGAALVQERLAQLPNFGAAYSNAPDTAPLSSTTPPDTVHPLDTTHPATRSDLLQAFANNIPTMAGNPTWAGDTGRQEVEYLRPYMSKETPTNNQDLYYSLLNALQSAAAAQSSARDIGGTG